MSDTDDATAGTGTGPGTTNWVKITNVFPTDCIGLSATVWVDYSNATLSNAQVGLGCGGATSPPDQTVAPGTGTCKFLLLHAAAAAGHTLAASLRQRAVGLASHSVSPVGIGNPCPLSVSGTDRIVSGFPTVDPTKPLSGTFQLNRGDRVLVMVEDRPTTDGPDVPPPVLVYAAPAEVDVSGKEGTWTHPVIKAAKKGYLLRVVLTKGGEVTTTVRAIFD
jgi:hypothetical protein